MQGQERIASNAWLMTPVPRPAARMRLVCFSYAGAGAAAYRGWASDAPDSLEVCSVQLPGRENRLREPTFASIPALIPHIVDALTPSFDRPFALYGHSLGSLVAFETARELRRRNGPMPTALFASASRAPQLPWPHKPVSHLDDMALLTEVHRRYGSVPDVILADAELRELLTPALRADMSLVETYAYEHENPFAFPIVAFGGDADTMVSHEALAQWEQQTSGPFRHRTLPGDHIFLQTARRTLLDDIGTSLDLDSQSAVSGAR